MPDIREYTHVITISTLHSLYIDVTHNYKYIMTPNQNVATIIERINPLCEVLC